MAVKPLSRPRSEKQKALGSARLSYSVRTWCRGLSFAGRREAPAVAQCGSVNAEAPRSLPAFPQPVSSQGVGPSSILSGPLCDVVC